MNFKDMRSKDTNWNVKYQLETLYTYFTEDVQDGMFDVIYEDDQGAERFMSVDCTILAKEALERILQLEEEVQRLKYRMEVQNCEIKRLV